MSTYEPGTVAVATVRGVPNVRVIRRATGWASGVEIDGTRVFHPDGFAAVTDIRPLVVLDPEDHKQVAQLLNRLQDMSYSAHACGAFSCLAEALRSLTRPPKPAEPKGLGAVVEDAKGGRWTNTGQDMPNRWACATDFEWGDYADIDAVKVLSEGVQS